jgi:hypothetical protein
MKEGRKEPAARRGGILSRERERETDALTDCMFANWRTRLSLTLWLRPAA